MADGAAMQTMASELPRPWLVVTDLDGTLLDHHNYSHKPVDELLPELEARGIPVVFNTSKTRQELLRLREELNNRHPFIVENGSAIYIPRGYFSQPVNGPEPFDEVDRIRLGRPISEIRTWLEEYRRRTNASFSGFADMSTSELMEATGLREHEAQMARAREYSEAILWRDSADKLARFRGSAEAAGFTFLQGGRFLHILGNCDKGRATERLAREYQLQERHAFSVIAAGDGDNDVDMLEAADLAIAVRSPVHDFPSLPSGQRVVYTSEYGPSGWAECLQQLLAQY